MKKMLISILLLLPLALVTAGAAMAQTQSAPQQQGRPGPRGFDRGPGAMGMGGMFEFERMVGGFGGKTVENAPFSADVTRETIEVLQGGNRIDRKSTGTMARDSSGRTRQEMSLPDIGPLAAMGTPPHLVFIRDNVAGKLYILNVDRKTARETNLWTGRQPERPWPGGKAATRMRGRMRQEEEQQSKTESLGTKTVDGLTVKGTRTTRTIPAGQIGNEKPIVITTEEWFSPDLQMTISYRHNDPRFGTTSYQLTNISRQEPPQAMFLVPQGYTLTLQQRPRQNGRPNPMPPQQ